MENDSRSDGFISTHDFDILRKAFASSVAEGLTDETRRLDHARELVRELTGRENVDEGLISRIVGLPLPSEGMAIVLPTAIEPTLADLKADGQGLMAYCGAPSCGQAWSLDIDVLIELYGTHYGYRNDRRISSKVRCPRCQRVGGTLRVVTDKRPRF
ncbi:hypothetical protein LHFGNBLO_004890 [Mesorhizobium sp. AR10]|uniref:hypothetical protein n=1 Tax=Mesorhizobium sp. AR10 TaxID=2865839 RepID=UPI002160F187|nr:hypothetical protein [Mesorhizobium sp. AR10]UVK37799.1 hypothetical protein LHFGNBLO_004890 [Mesorhizobium sp. AR10]